MRRTRPALVAVALAVLLTACTPQPGPSLSPSTTGFANEEEAFAAAEATYRAYVDALNQVDLADPATFEPVYAWLTGDALAEEKKSLTGMHAAGLVVGGTSRAVLVHPLMDLLVEETAQLAICLDVSAVTLVDAEGVSAVSPERPNVQSMTVTLVRTPASETGWRLGDFVGREGSPECPH